MREKLWKRFFKITDRIFKNQQNYLVFKSKKLPSEKIPNGMSVSFNSKIKAPKIVVQKYNDIDFFTLKTTLGIFEIKLITYKDRGKVFYTVHNLQNDVTFTLDEKAFRLLFRHENIPGMQSIEKRYMRRLDDSQKNKEDK
jgi:hypothetical protein